MTENKEVQERPRRTIPDEERCEHKHADGRRCGSRRRDNRPFCWHHDPETAEARKQALARAEAEPDDPEPDEEEEEAAQLLSPEEIHELLSQALEAVQAGKMTVSRAYAVGYLASMLLATLKEIGKVAEQEGSSLSELLRMVRETVEDE